MVNYEQVCQDEKGMMGDKRLKVKKWVMVSASIFVVMMGRGTVVNGATTKESYAKDQRQGQLSYAEYVSFNQGLVKTPSVAPRVVNLPVSSKRAAIVKEALKHLGKPYTQEAKKRMGPSAFDCSGLTYYVFQQVTGKNIGTWTVPQETAGTRIPLSAAQPGDLYFWGDKGNTYHVAIAIGNNQYVHSPTFNEVVKVETVNPYFTPSFALRMNLDTTSLNLSDYYTTNPGRVATKKNDALYKSVEFSQSTLKKQVPKNTLLTVQSIEYANNGTPRLKTAEGYFSAAKGELIKVVSDIDRYHTTTPTQVATLKEDYYYSGVEFNTGTRRQKVSSGSLLTVQGIEYSSGGLPRLKTVSGFISGAKKDVVKPVSSLNNYFSVNPQKVMTLKDDSLYAGVEFNDKTRKSNVKAGAILTVQKIEFSLAGIPRLKTASGYFTAEKKNLRQVPVTIDTYYTANPLKVVTLKEDSFYSKVDFTTSTRKAKVKAGTVLTIQKIEYTSTGIPRLKTSGGYYSASKGSVVKTINAIDQYVTIPPLKVMILKDDYLYGSVDFTSKTRKKWQKKGTVLAVLKIEYTANGTPRLKTKEGYFTAHKGMVKPIK